MKNIIVNGIMREWHKDTISYTELLNLVHHAQDSVVTVTYQTEYSEGSLIYNNRIEVSEGAIFNIHDTSVA